MYSLEVSTDRSENKLIISKELHSAIGKIQIHEEELEFSVLPADSGLFEMELQLEEVLPKNTFFPVEFLDGEDKPLEVKTHQQGVFPLYFRSMDIHALIVLSGREILIRFVDAAGLHGVSEKSSSIQVQAVENAGTMMLNFSGSKQPDLKSLVLTAIQKESNIQHLLPLTFQEGKVAIPRKYVTGLFSLELFSVINNHVFLLSSLTDGESQSREKNTVSDEITEYAVEKEDNNHFTFRFGKKLDEGSSVRILTSNHYLEGSIRDDSTAAFINPGLADEKKAFLVISQNGRNRLEDLRKNGNFMALGILNDIPRGYKYNFPQALLNNRGKANIRNIQVGDTKLSFELVDENEHIWHGENPFLLLKQRKNKRISYIQGKKVGKTYQFDFKYFLEEETANGSIRWDIYLLNDAKSIKSYQLGCFEEYISDKPDRFFDMFSQEFPVQSTYNRKSRIYLTNKNELALVKSNISNLIREEFDIKTKVTSFSMSKNIVRLKLNVNSKYHDKFSVGDIQLIQRNKDDLQVVSFKTEKSAEGNTCSVSCEIDLLEKELFPLYWDVYIAIIVDGKENFVRISQVTKKVAYDVDRTISKYQLEVNGEDIMYPYITISNDLSFTYRQKEYFENRYYLFKENLAYYFVKAFGKFFEKRDIWIAFEKLAMSAHDSGYYFFDYVYKNKKHDDFYYVIRKDSPELANLLDKKDKIIYFMSFKYFVYMFASKLLVSSDTKRNSYNLKLKKSKLARELTDKKLVYLQHGVNGLKVVRDFYKDRNVFDLVIAPSEYEKKMIIDHWGYDESEVVATGLARWDGLVDKSHEIDYKQIFLMPTWRTWMDGMTRENFVKTEYFQQYNAFLTSERLNGLLKQNNVKLKFFLHPKFRDYIDLFDITSSQVEKFGFLEVPMDEMIMKSSLMISDYSSVIWEMFYLKKPCVFYHFDKDKYLEYEGSYMDFDNDLFGDVAWDTEALIDIVESYIDNDFKEKEEFGRLRDEYFTYMDKKNSERIYEAIEDNRELLYSKKKRKWKVTHLIPFRIRRLLLDIKDKVVN